MASEPVHFLFSESDWAAVSASLAEHCHVQQLVGYVLCTRQNEAAAGILEGFRAAVGVTEIAHDDISAWKSANESLFPPEE